MKHSNHDHTPGNKGADHQKKTGKEEQGSRTENMNMKGQKSEDRKDWSAGQDKSQRMDTKPGGRR